MKPNYRILIVDDEENVRRMLSTAFALSGQETFCARDGREAVRMFTDHPPDVVLMDIRMPDVNGIEALQQMHALHPRIPVILMTAYAEVETAVEALRCGAFDYVIKPFDLDELQIVIQRALALESMKQEINSLHKALTDSWQWGHILTTSPNMMEVCRDTAKIALSQASVLISGESGTGKELIARAIHYNSRRACGPFIKVNCAALPESLLESELFGHEKGAFTGAQVQRLGLFERAHQGTLLLDEVGEMPLNLQAKLLRVLQEREFERIGGHQTVQVDIRIVAATNRNLAAMVEDATFRQDLFYRLNVIHLEIPPLRERTQDIPLLANHFLQKFSAENQRDIIDIDPAALACLCAWHWPGNIRELSNVIERAVIMSTGAVIFIDDLPAPLLSPPCTGSDEKRPAASEERNLKDEMKRYEKKLIIETLENHDGNRTHSALALGISRRALMYKLQEYGIDPLSRAEP
ncbi:acetoacetate metabolism transcriptional regulator AtoC [Enterobacteriaceae bacterium 4M9]|nr:acetoacetate metabolism transcriptional regulator AtoC [Enterobacteriaceae bacterium 4M9]